MADSPRLQVLKLLTAHLETITVENGYSFDLAGHVFRGRNMFGDAPEDVVPMLSLLEAPRSDQGIYADDSFDLKLEEWNLHLQGWVDDDVENPTDPAYGLVWEVQKCLLQITELTKSGGVTPGEPGRPAYPNSYLLGKTITSLKTGSPICRPPTEGLSSKAFFYLPLRVGLAHEVG